MKTYTKEELAETINKHSAWLRGEEVGQRADLRDADLQDADLRGADLQRADLRGAKNTELSIAQTSITPDGEMIGWKKCKNDIIVKLKIPSDAKRSNATGRKCRAEFAEVIEIFGATEAISTYNNTVVYRTGETVTCHQWDDDRWNECSGGIHFFLTRVEAENY